MDQAMDSGATPLFSSSQKGHIEIASLLLGAGAAVDQATDSGATPLSIACVEGHDRVVSLLLSFGASRRLPASDETPEGLASLHGHHVLHAWLVRTRAWSTRLHYLECISAERARTLLRGGADLRASEHVGGLSPIRLAQELAGKGEAVTGSAAHEVLQAAQPWSFSNHHLFPLPARRRAVALLMIGYQFAACQGIPELVDAWRGGGTETPSVLSHAITRET